MTEGTKDSEIDAIKAKTDNLPSDPADQSAVEAKIDAQTLDLKGDDDRDLTEVYDNTPSIDPTTVWTHPTRTLTEGTKDSEIDAIKSKTDNLPADPASNTQVNTRLATAGYTAPDNSSVTAIKAKTDNLPSDPASETNATSNKNEVIAELGSSGLSTAQIATAVWGYERV